MKLRFISGPLRDTHPILWFFLMAALVVTLPIWLIPVTMICITDLVWRSFFE